MGSTRHLELNSRGTGVCQSRETGPCLREVIGSTQVEVAVLLIGDRPVRAAAPLLAQHCHDDGATLSAPPSAEPRPANLLDRGAVIGSNPLIYSRGGHRFELTW